MADTYLNSVLAEDSRQQASATKGSFVAVGSHMWTIWRIVLQFKHVRPSAKLVVQALWDSIFETSLSFGEVPKYAKNISWYSRLLNPRLGRGGEVSMAKWLPMVDEPFPNPWFDVASFLTIPDEFDQQARRFRFTSLPNELKAYTAQFLPKESAIAFALTCKTMYDLLGQRFFDNLSTQEHWDLILLLERDSDLLAACQECMKLHSPFAPRRRRTDTLPCINQPKSILPNGVTPTLCRLFAKRYIRQMPYIDLLSTAAQTVIFTLPDFKLFSQVTFHLRAGNLFVRQETSIAPLTAHGELTGRGAFLLNETTENTNASVCPHIRWQHLGLELCCGPKSGTDYPSSLSAAYLGSQQYPDDHLQGNFRDRIGSYLSKMDGERILDFNEDDRYATADPNGRCRGSRRFHIGPCYDSTAVPRTVLEDALGPGLKCSLLHSQPCADRDCDRQPSRFKVNLVRACEICATDMCVSAQDIQGIGRVVTQTTWKNLGGVYSGQWSSWHTHYSDVEKFTRRFLVDPEYSQITRDLSKGVAVYTAFENIPTNITESSIC